MAKSLISSLELIKLSKEVLEDCKLLAKLWKSQQLLDYEVAGLYILIFYLKWKPTHWIGSRRSHSHSNNRPPIASFIPSLKCKETECHDVYSFYSTYQLKFIPQAAQTAILRWADGMYPLIATSELPTSEAVLKYQAQNQRVVSLLLPPPSAYVLGERDPMSFVLHDLVHAFHFFENSEIRNEQIGFYKCMQVGLTNEVLQKALSDSGFAKDFEYLISDMNSVSLHLCMSLKSIFLQFYLRERDYSPHHKLSPHEKNEFEKKFLAFSAAWCSEPQVLESLRVLNEPDFDRKKDGLMITEFFKKISHRDSSFQTFVQV